MKLPELKVYETQKDYARANRPYNSNQYELDKVLRHNEQIAAQLTIAFYSQDGAKADGHAVDYRDDVANTYEYFLIKLNKGEL